METEQAKSTENHVVEILPPEYEPKTQRTLRYQKDRTVPSSQGKALNLGGLLPASRGHLATLGKGAPGSGGQRPRMLLNIVQCTGQPPYNKSSNPKCLQC